MATNDGKDVIGDEAAGELLVKDECDGPAMSFMTNGKSLHDSPMISSILFATADSSHSNTYYKILFTGLKTTS